MIVIDENLLNHITLQAKKNNRLRKNFNLHNSLDEKVQRLLNALEPGTIVPIHRHRHTSETYILVRGRLVVNIYNEQKQLTKSELLNPMEGKYGISIPKNEWHSVEVLEKGTVIFEVKEGPYAPLQKEDILI